MPEMKLDHLSSMPMANTDDNQREKLLYLLERMRQIQGSADNQRVPLLNLHSPAQQSPQQSLKRPGFSDEQPLDFSAKKFRPSSRDWSEPSFSYNSNKHDSLESDGNSLELDSQSIASDSHSDLSGSRSPDSMPGSHSADSLKLHQSSDSGAHSPGSDISPRLPQPGSSSPPKPALPSLKIETPENSGYLPKPDLLTTVTSLQSTTPIQHLNRPLIKPLSSLQAPQVPPPTPEQFNPLLNLAGVASMQGFPHLPSLPIFNSQTQNHLQYPSSPLNFNSSPIPPFGVSPAQPPLSELAMMNSNSQHKYANFREAMLRNIERSKVSRKHPIGNIKSEDQQDEDRSSSINMTASPMSSLSSTMSTPISMASTPIDNTPSRNSGDKDEAYWERRRKNNEAAKRSRDSRKQKENEIAVRASYLEQENIQLKMELAQVKAELGSYREQQLAQVKMELGSFRDQQQRHNN